MRPDEISIAVNGATAEGWNPGLTDDACFAAADPEGFFIGELKGALAATVSCVNYGASFALLHFYTVRKDLRGRGYGLRIWNAAIAHAGPRVIGLDGVLAQQQNCTKSGSSSLMPTSGSGLVSTGKWAVPGAYSENGDNCQMQLRRRVRTH
jgi:GNAT superfamily N-acetyltransferase